jgi:hypothetical protein
MTTRHLESLEKREMMEISEREEELAMQRHLRELDCSTLDDIERRFGQYIPQGRLERLRQKPACFLRHQEYEEHLRQRGIEVGENESVLGDANGRVYVDREHILVPKTLAHERLHQLSDRLYQGMLGKEIDEGTTEHFASYLRGDLHIADMGKCYPEQQKLVEMLSSRVGDNTIARAYFQGDWIGLKEDVNRQLGDGALAEICGLAKQGRFEEAEEIIKRGL